MTNIDAIKQYLKSNNSTRYRDDCLSAMLKVYPRQQVNQICNRLFYERSIRRGKDNCASCSKYKLTNWIIALA